MSKHHRGSDILGVVCLHYIHAHCTVKRVLSGHSKTKIGFQDQYRLMQVKSIAEWEHSAVLSIFIKLPFVIKIFVLSIFECSLRLALLYSKFSNSAPAHEILVLIALLSNEGSGESAQMCRLARAFAAQI